MLKPCSLLRISVWLSFELQVAAQGNSLLAQGISSGDVVFYLTWKCGNSILKFDAANLRKQLRLIFKENDGSVTSGIHSCKIGTYLGICIKLELPSCMPWQDCCCINSIWLFRLHVCH